MYYTKLFEVEFFGGTENFVHKEDGSEEIYLENGILLIKESDLNKLEGYGSGIKNLKYIGHLFEFEQKSLGITLKTEVTGLEEANRLAKELKNTLDSMEVKFKVIQ